MTLSKKEQALALLGELFEGRQRIPIPEAVERARARGISVSTLQRAARELGIHTVRQGTNPGFWEIPLAKEVRPDGDR